MHSLLCTHSSLLQQVDATSMALQVERKVLQCFVDVGKQERVGNYPMDGERGECFVTKCCDVIVIDWETSKDPRAGERAAFSE